MAEINAEIHKVDQFQTSTRQAAEPPIQGLMDWSRALFPWSVIGPAFREECRAIAAGKPMPRFLSPYARAPAAFPGVTLRGHPFNRGELELRRDIAAIVAEGRP